MNNNILRNIKLKYKTFVAFIGYFLLPFMSISQPYNNGWINYNQQYYTLKIAEDGIYRIDSTTLANAGIPISTINPKNIQIFARGVEIPIYIEGENDGVFNGSDFIEFYAHKNDGWFDQQLYNGAINQADPYYSLINDTIKYFLTWNNSTTNNRLLIETDTNFSIYTSENYVDKENLNIYTTNYYDGELDGVDGQKFGYNSTEGWFDYFFSLSSPTRIKPINTKNAYTSAGNAFLETVVLGESNYANINNGDHHLQITVGSNLVDTIFEGYGLFKFNRTIPIANLGSNTTNINYQIINDLGSGADKIAIAYIKLSYPHTLDFEGLTTFDKFYVLDNTSGTKSYLNFTNFTASGNVIFYDLTNNKRIKVVNNGSNYQCLIPNSGNKKECYVTSDGQVKNVSNLNPVNGNGFFMDYATTPVDTAFLIITNASLMPEAIEIL